MGGEKTVCQEGIELWNDHSPGGTGVSPVLERPARAPFFLALAWLYLTRPAIERSSSSVGQWIP